MEKILIVDDTEINIDILVEILSEYDLLVATDGYSAIEILKEEKVDLILLDILMPEISGFETCKLIKDDPELCDIPVIFLTAKLDEDAIEEAYDVGGIDFVTKPFKPRELKARIKTQLNLKELLYKLEYMASYDAMTGIYNRRKFFELANDKFKTRKDNLSAVMLDIDNFKKINDNYGHPVGDIVIKETAKLISKLINENTTLARLGGEEFVILYEDTDYSSIISEVENIRKEIERLDIQASSETVINFTISSGIFQYNTSIKTIDELLKNADDALYEAKNLGRNRLVFRT